MFPYTDKRNRTRFRGLSSTEMFHAQCIKSFCAKYVFTACHTLEMDGKKCITIVVAAVEEAANQLRNTS